MAVLKGGRKQKRRTATQALWLAALALAGFLAVAVVIVRL